MKIGLLALLPLWGAYAFCGADSFIRSGGYAGLGIGGSSFNIKDLKKETNDFTKIVNKRKMGFRVSPFVGFQYCIPDSLLVLGTQVALDLGGGRSTLDLDIKNSNLSDIISSITSRVRRHAFPIVERREEEPSALVHNNLKWHFRGKNRGGFHLSLISGVKLKNFLPYIKGTFALHSIRYKGECLNTSNIGGAIMHTTYDIKGRGRFRSWGIGGGVEYGVTKNIFVGGEFIYSRGKTKLCLNQVDGVSLKEKEKIKSDSKDFALTCKYLFPVVGQ